MLTGTRVTAIEPSRAGWVVNGAYASPVLVGAGGHFCPVARKLDPPPGRGAAPGVITAQEVEFKLSADAARHAPATPEFHFCRDLEGYGWVFRKGDYLNVGFGRRAGPGFPAHVAAFQGLLGARHDLPPEAVCRWKGHAYLLATDGRRAVGPGALLVGDAAGLADAASGEGIRAAVESGLLAADVIAEAGGIYTRDRLEPYAVALSERFGHRRPPGVTRLVPPRVKRVLAAPLMQSRWFARHVLLDAWFLKAS